MWNAEFIKKTYGPTKGAIIAYNRDRNIQKESDLLAITDIRSELLILGIEFLLLVQSFLFIVGMDRLNNTNENEASILCLLASIKHVLATMESRYFMGVNKQSIDVAFHIFSTTPEFGVIYTFINEMFLFH